MQSSRLASGCIAKHAKICTTLRGMITPNRNHRVSDPIYGAAKDQAERDGITPTDVVVACLAAYGGTDQRPAGIQLHAAITRALGIQRCPDTE